ncbi:hypothetical protein C8N32_102223 [Rhodovulum imhoffii]|uniref:Uncharacterized protein n=1 Tax=Rhodovulum imhoffii TaxID=365340 RepID=A0A2T5BVU0_9RHOB|nr:hypothetical protein [Rhodovulum imhoffii]MBK5933205.1 hypothetical protein [Rhodovulum imhoffii]PTN03694.1 hypothetical protein C8N32_102223 [Rhodovulum imhoffii]
MPQLVRLYIRQTLIGFVLSAVFVAMLLSFNVANLWHLVTHVSLGWVAVVMLFVFNGIVFAGVQFGISIMRMTEEDDRGSGGKRQPQPVNAPVLLTVPVQEPRQHQRLR